MLIYTNSNITALSYADLIITEFLTHGTISLKYMGGKTAPKLVYLMLIEELLYLGSYIIINHVNNNVIDS